ncbi:hypothetical protein [Bradyrhizobium sp.]|uniref:hypothetical protein n=1 Tax=Bradyrhizobium sp. TaxID=376 RepID=UPI003BB0C596
MRKTTDMAELSISGGDMTAEELNRDRRKIGSTELNLDQLEAVSGGDQKPTVLATTLSNIANMQHDMQKTVANNLRA